MRTPKIHWPACINEEFYRIAHSMIDPVDKRTVETIAFVVGYVDVMGDRHATHIVFPAQNGGQSQVEDLGINGRHTLDYAYQVLAPTIAGPGKVFTVIAWVRSLFCSPLKTVEEMPVTHLSLQP